VCSILTVHFSSSPLSKSHAVGSYYKPNKENEALKVYKTNDSAHPAVAYIKSSHEYYAGGAVEAVKAPTHYDFVALRSMNFMASLQFLPLPLRFRASEI